MRCQLRVLVVSFLPPARGGIATWAGILRDGAPDAPCLFSFEDLAPAKTEDGSMLSKAFVAARLFGRLAFRFVLGRPDVTHLNCCLSPLGLWRDLLIALLSTICRIPVVVHHRGSLPDAGRLLPASSALALRALTRIAAVNLVVTRDSENALRRRGVPTAYLSNFIEESWCIRPRAARTDRVRPRAVYAGRLSVDKGSLDLFQVAAEIPEIEFVLMGDVSTEVRPALESASANVIAMGHVPRARVVEELLTSDVFVLPSHREGFPNAVLEAMAAGLPVVSTRVGGVPEMIEEGLGGFLVSSGDRTALAQAVRRLAADRPLARRMGAHNRRLCSDRFGLTAGLRDLCRIYEQLALSKRSLAWSHRPGWPSPARGLVSHSQRPDP